MLKRWATFTRFLDDGRICLTNNAAERTLRGIALGRKAWLFAGSDRGGERAAAIYLLIVTCKLNGVDPRAWLADVLARIAAAPVAAAAWPTAAAVFGGCLRPRNCCSLLSSDHHVGTSWQCGLDCPGNASSLKGDISFDSVLSPRPLITPESRTEIGVYALTLLRSLNDREWHEPKNYHTNSHFNDRICDQLFCTQFAITQLNARSASDRPGGPCSAARTR